MSATKLYIDDNSNDGADRSAALSLIRAGDELRISQRTDDSRWAKWSVTADSIDRTGYFEVSIAYVDGEGTIPNSGAAVILNLLTMGATAVVVADETAMLPRRAVLNFTGIGVTAADDAANDRINVTIPGGGSQTPWAQDVDGGGYSLSNVHHIVTSTYVACSPLFSFTFMGFLTPSYAQRWQIERKGTESGANSGSDLQFDSFDDSGTFLRTTVALQRSNGHVGIGTSSPGYKLDVAGDCNVTGSYRKNGTPIDVAATNAQTGTSYTLVASDHNKIITLNNAAAITLTVPAGLGSGFSCLLIQLGAGAVTVAASGVTVQQRQSFTKTAGQYAVASLLAYAANTFVLSGDLSA